VKNAAIHYHFPTKGDLGCAVVRRYRDRFRLWVNNARIKDLPPEKKLDWFFGIYRGMRADKGKVCLAGSLETEFNSLPAALQDETKALTGDLLAWLQALLDEGRRAGAFHFEGDSAGRSALILSSLQGALQMARALGTRKFQAVVEQNRQDLIG
jgi:AcrR family transcriptional regulator